MYRMQNVMNIYEKSQDFKEISCLHQGATKSPKDSYLLCSYVNKVEKALIMVNDFKHLPTLCNGVRWSYNFKF